MKIRKIKRISFFFLILCTFSLFLYYYFTPTPNNSYKSSNIDLSSNEEINLTLSNSENNDITFQNTQSGLKNNEKNEIIDNNTINHSTSLCPICNFTPIYPPSSTRRDVVLAAALNKLKRVETFLRTLRMTGSKCRIILFLDNQNTIEPHFLRFFKSCDIEPVFVNNNNNSILRGGAKMTRYYYYQQWLSMHINEVDRVLHSDTFDVIFQSDPFREDMLPMKNEQNTIKQNPILFSTDETKNSTKNHNKAIPKFLPSNLHSKPEIQQNIEPNKNNKNLNKKSISKISHADKMLNLTKNKIYKNKTNRINIEDHINDQNSNSSNTDNSNLQNVLYFTFEPVLLGDSRWTASWVSKCYGHNVLHKYRKKPVSCSGVTIGYAKAFLTYLNVMLSKNSWNRCFGDSLDQAHHNYVLYHGDLQNAGLEIKSLDCNSKFLTMHFCCKKGSCHLDEKTNIVYGNATNQAPVLVHQYNRWKNLTKRNKFFCPGSAKDLFESKSNEIKMAEIDRLPPLKIVLPEKLM